MMTREEAIKQLESLYDHCENMRSGDNDFAVWERDCEAIKIALSALRPVSREQELEAENKELKERIVNWRKYMTPTREQVEKVWRGEWKCYGDCGITECSACGWNIEEYVGDYNFCPVCGAPMTDEAADMVMERLEALYENT